MNRVISKEKVNKGTPREPNRTRWLYTLECSGCGKGFTRLNKPNLNVPCKSCKTKNNRLQNFINKVETRFSNIRIVDFSDFKSLESTVVALCTKHDHRFSVKAKLLASPIKSERTGGCPKCVEELRKTDFLHSVEHYTSILTDISDGNVTLIHTFNPSDKVGGTQDVIAECKLHGKFSTTFRTVTSSSKGCAECGRSSNSHANRMYNISDSGNLYFIQLKLNGNILYKLGVAKDVDLRIQRIPSEEDIQILWTYSTDTLQLAYLLEHILLIKYRNLRITDSELVKTSTEFLNSFIEKPTKGFVEEILRLTEPKTGNSDH